MIHKGGKRAKKQFRRLQLSKAMKERIEDLPHRQLQVLLAFIRALMASSKSTRSRSVKTARKTGRKLRAGVHRVKVGKRMRNVRVLSNGKWRFLKG